MKKPNHEKIYLIPGSYDGEHCYVWSDDPAPGTEYNPDDAIEYVRADLAQSNEMLANRIVELTNERDALAAQVERLLTHLEDAHSNLGFLSTHLRGRMGEAALLDMAEKADDWREFCEQLRQSAKAGS